MKPTLMLVILATTLVLLSPMVSSASAATQEKITAICGQLEDRQFCNQTFNNFLTPTIDVGYNFLTGLAITEARKNATNTLAFIRTSLLPGVKDPGTFNHYKVCEQTYNVLKDTFIQAFDDFSRFKYGDMNSEMKGTPRVQAACPTSFGQDPLAERNREMRILLTMAIVTGSHIAPPIKS